MFDYLVSIRYFETMELNSSDKTIQYLLNYDEEKWPSQDKYPLNISDQHRKVGYVLEQDLSQTDDCLIITGFTSLARLIEWFGTDKFPKLNQIKILLGNDPILRKRNKYPFSFIDIELREYWINKGISLYLGSSVLRLIDRLNEESIKIRFRKRSHAKIYVSKESAIIGSSNFSKSGLEIQNEANVRKTKVNDEDEYNDIKKIAELLYHDKDSESYNSQLIDLLNELLADVTWEEALARAIGEILEGRWFANNNEFFENLDNKTFWPTQEQGLVEAINILIDKGNVLIADPTGSGKTKMCSAIIISFLYWLWQVGEKANSNLLLFSPPMVISNWEKEFRDLRFLNYTLRSLGILSNASDDHLKDILKELSLSNILAVDEAHNLLNPVSQRSRNLASNRAEYKLLITATPVNKRLDDLLRIIELLDVDNLNDEDFKLFKEIKEKRTSLVSSDDRAKLKGFIDNFLVRRTKSELNEIIAKDPEKYRNSGGSKCKFPEVNNLSYNTLETDKDKSIVDQISAEAKQLKGLNYLKSITPPEYFIRTENEKKNYVRIRKEAAKSLAIYKVRSCLRSSKVALIEALVGTKKANIDFGVESNKDKTGDVIGTIEGLIGSMPEINFECEDIPNWLKDPEEYKKACIREIKIYKNILDLASQLSFGRENGKVAEILSLLENHDLVVAFDSKLITLDFLNKILHQKKEGIRTFVATGSNKAVVEKVLRVCRPGSTATNTVIFCSDVMSEGVNLQRASALILLDLPSVIRLVEQRIGRIDRMDTDHKKISVLWPNDSEQFSLKGDRRLIKTSLFVDATLGGNFHIPPELRDKHFDDVGDVVAIQRELEEKKGEKGWEGSRNFFRPIQDLRKDFVNDEVYQHILDVKAQIKTRVSFYESKNEWCFICTRGSLNQSPKWLFLQIGSIPETNFIEVASKLRKYLPIIEGQRLSWDQKSLDKYLKEFRKYERLLLPEKKRRALEVAEFVLRKYLTKKSNGQRFKSLLRNNQTLFNPTIKEDIPDFQHLSSLWLEILQPVLDNRRNLKKNRRKAFNLSCIKEDWRKVKLNEETLKSILNNYRRTESIDYKIAACIIGIKIEVDLDE